MSTPRYSVVPSTPSAMPQPQHVFSVVVPVARTNEITNPSFEVDTTGWAAVNGASIARTAAWQAAGAWGLQLTLSSNPNDGVRYSSLPMVAGELRACSLWFQGTQGKTYRFQIENGGGGTDARIRVVATGRPQQVVWYCPTTTTATYYLFVGVVAGGADVCYLDAVQVEVIQAGEVYSTYIDGDQRGLVPNQSPPAYYWTGTPHASTSVRTLNTRAGGMVVPLSQYSFALNAIVGLGLAPPQNVGTSYGRLDGGFDAYTRKPERQFTLVGQLSAMSELQLRSGRGGLARVLDRDASNLDQQLRLRYHRQDDAGVQLSTIAQIDAKYSSGLEGNHSNPHMEDLALTFEQYQPQIVGAVGDGAALSPRQTVVDANMTLLRTAAGNWQAIGTGGDVTGSVFAIAQGRNGIIYIGGDFPSFSGVASTGTIAQYDPRTGVVSAMGSGASGGGVNGIEIAPNGDVWAFGSFINMDGIAAADYVARWDGSAWNAVGTATSTGFGFSQRGAFGADGSFYYTTLSGATVRKWSGAAWSTLGTVTGGAAQVYTVVRAPNGDLIVCGNFTAINAVSALNVARWNGTAWIALNGTIPGVSATLAYTADGMLYAGGQASGSNLWRYNGTGWTTVGAIGTSSTFIYGLAPTLDGGLYVVGTFITANGVAIPDGFGYWNGAALVGSDIDVPGVSDITAVSAFQDGSVGVGFTAMGSAAAAALTTVTTTGTARTYPTLQIKGPTSGTARIYQIVNTTTGRGIYLNLTLNAGETATLHCQPGALSFTSAFQGNIARTILPGSNEADFFLAPGDNVISFYTSSNTVAPTLTWQPSYASLDDVP